MKNSSSRTRGVTVIEAIIAIGIFATLSTVAYQARLSSHRLLERESNKTKAVLLAEEGIEAVRSIRDTDFNNLSDGVNGLNHTASVWSFSGTEDTTDSKFTRSVTISSADSDSKRVTTKVDWSERGVNNSVTLTSILTNWRKLAGGMADSVTINTTAANLSSASGRALLTGIVLASDGTAGTTTITQIVVSWTKTQRTLESIYSPNGQSVFGPSSVSTGSTVTLASPIVFLGVAAKTIEFLFSNNMQASNFTFTFIMSDGSTKSVTVNSPPTGP